MSFKKDSKEIVVYMVRKVLENRRDIKAKESLINEATSYILRQFPPNLITNNYLQIKYIAKNPEDNQELLKIIELLAIASMAIDYILTKKRNKESIDKFFS